MRLLARAPAKVNLCLFLGPRREDGRHELVTLFESVSLADELMLETVGSEGSDGSVGSDARPDELVCRGVSGPNLASDAISSLRAHGWSAPAVRIEIVKRIPVAGGMGGGSADAAAALRMADALVPDGGLDLMGLAASLGSDVPGQLRPGLVLGTGAGDRVESLPPQAPHAFVIVPLGAELSTADVYREADRLGLPRHADDLAPLHAELRVSLREGERVPDTLLVNDLEPAALSLCPEIGDALEAVRWSGADQAIVCGSGPTVAGLFWGPDASRRAEVTAASVARWFPSTVTAEPVGEEFGFPRHA